MKSKVLSLLLCLLTMAAVISQTMTEVCAAYGYPGKQTYYDARWEEAEVAVGYMAPGKAYTNNTGASVTTTNGGPWNLELDWGNTCSQPWSGNAVAPTKTTTVLNAAHETVMAYEVYTGEEFRWCVNNNESAKLMNDLDLNGYNTLWETPNDGSSSAVIDGNGHTIYNFYGNDSMFGKRDGLFVDRLRVSNSYIYTFEGRKGFFLRDSTNANFYGCAIENSLFRTELEGYYGIAGFTFGCKGTIINQCYVRNFHLYDLGCVATFTDGDSDQKITNSFAADCSVITTRGHAGGFLSCFHASCEVENCFTSNVNVYGNLGAGGFVGVSHSTVTTTINNCYASGKVEGTEGLGGFIGAMIIKSDTTQNTYINNCYSTSMVGLPANYTSQMQKLGGFMGSHTLADDVGPNNNYNLHYTNCYAAGEVGSVYTSDMDAENGNGTISGFTGDRADIFTDDYKNCYVDAQTTAMKDWVLGGSTRSYTSTELQTNSKNTLDIKSVLTSNSIKAGTGLTSSPSSNGVGNQGTDAVNRSFTGFTDNSKWTFVEGYYPQLSVFTNPTSFANTNWMTQEDLHNVIKACSQASVVTVQLDVWETDYLDNALPVDSYDTVRDMISGAPLTSASNIYWSRCGVQFDDIYTNGTGTKSWPFLTSRDASGYSSKFFEKEVINLSQDSSGQWEVTDPAPGIDWLRATATVGGQTASRKIRLIPRCAIKAGSSTTLDLRASFKTYDHADDMAMAYARGGLTRNNGYLTAKVDHARYSYGGYPDNPFWDSSLLASNSKNAGGITPYSHEYTLAELLEYYKGSGQNDNYSNVDVGYMQRTFKKIPAKTTPIGNTLNTVITKGSSKNDLSETMGEKFNGNAKFEESDVGEYLITYYWTVNDGRYISDSKTLVVTADSSFYPGVTVKVIKNVVDESGTASNKDTFTFRVKIHNSENTYFLNRENFSTNKSGLIKYKTSMIDPYTCEVVVELNDDGWLSLPGIRKGSTIEIIEDDVDGYSTTYRVEGSTTEIRGRTVTIDDIQEDQTITFTNTTGNNQRKKLIVSKVVPNTLSGAGQLFDFSVDISDGADHYIPADGTYKIYQGSTEVNRQIDKDSDGTLHFSLKNGEHLEVETPTGYDARVCEVYTDGYDTRYSVSSTDGFFELIGESNVILVKMNMDRYVTFTNTPKATSLTVKKTVVGEGSDTFQFRIDFDHPRVIDKIPADTNSPARYEIENGAITFSLKDGEQVEIPEIPYGTDLTVTELAHDGYEAKVYDITGGIRDLISRTDSVDLTLTKGKSIEFVNNNGVDLPNSGGFGTGLFYAVGGVLLLGAGVLLVVHKKMSLER